MSKTHLLSEPATLSPSLKGKARGHDLFTFLQIFEREGGIQSYVKDILSAYLALNAQPRADVMLLRDGPGCPNPFENSRFKFHYFKSQSEAAGRARFTAALLTQLIRQRPRQVFCGHIKLATLVQSFCQPLGIPYTVLTYGKEVWSPLSPREQQALQRAAAVWTISRYSRDQLCSANNLALDRVQLLPCVVDTHRFTPGPKSSALVERYGLSGAKVLMTVARLWSGDIYKGVDVTIRALPTIAQAFPDIKYLVIGRGDDQPRLAQLARDLGVADQVVFAGFVPTEDLPEHYRVADAYVMPSQEGFGIVYLEALACGLPVLSGDADGSADPLQDGRLGWRVPHRDAAAVATACIEMLRGEDRRCNGAFLREQILQTFGLEAHQRRVADLLQVSSPRPSPHPSVASATSYTE
ncbi:glycosyltransferase [Leptolyngbya sp. FACHB-261]|uniref:glycosyltransferase n=1 Tax=Leptolyngbya sp. FACHB-261 TaxID=2692806 RepID=UPI001687E01A|nr:glycosyltransferase [Leptolyngbya sp. FACHB-261]MBD2099534.1 glycosyltransferase [Leptolyngbya sp. FACHB-261]